MKKLWSKLPETPGVYLMRDVKRHLLYIGKAANLRRRVQSYFTRPHDTRVAKLVSLIRRIDHQKTETALEALILEAALIKKHQPPFNVQEKDDTSFLYVVFTKEKFPRILLARGRNVLTSDVDTLTGEIFGPFIQGGSIRAALQLLRKIFPWSTHSSEEVERAYQAKAALPTKAPQARRRACFEYELGLCPGTCMGLADRTQYAANIRRLKQIFRGKRKEIIRDISRAMKAAAKREEFEKATIYRRQLFALKHIQDIALIKDNDNFQFSIPNFQSRLRIEGYDVSNISGTAATGSMVVFRGDRPVTEEYRLFKIRTLYTPNDVGMLREVLTRRFKNNWPLPDLLLIDGGKGQVNAARAALKDAGLVIPIVGLAKGPTRKRTDIIGDISKGVSLKTLVRVRDEAHRFAHGYHVRLRGRNFAKA